MSQSAGTGDRPDFSTVWDFKHPDASEAMFRALLGEARAAGDSDYAAEVLTQVARAEGLQRRFEEAHRTLDEVEGMLRPDMRRARVRYLLERGRVFNSSNRKEEARPLFVAAWDLAREAGEENLAVDAAHMIAIAAPPEEAIEWNLRAMKEAEAAGDPKAKNWLGSLYNNLGWAYHDRGDYVGALGLFEKAYDWRRGRNQPVETRIAKWCIARTLRSLGRVDEALRMQEELLQEWDASEQKQDGYVYEELGECLLLKGRAEEAAKWFATAYGELSKDPWLSANEPARLARMEQLGGVPGR